MCIVQSKKRFLKQNLMWNLFVNILFYECLFEVTPWHGGCDYSKPLGGSKGDLDFHALAVNQMSTRNSWELSG